MGQHDIHKSRRRNDTNHVTELDVLGMNYVDLWVQHGTGGRTDVKERFRTQPDSVSPEVRFLTHQRSKKQHDIELWEKKSDWLLVESDGSLKFLWIKTLSDARARYEILAALAMLCILLSKVFPAMKCSGQPGAWSSKRHHPERITETI